MNKTSHLAGSIVLLLIGLSICGWQLHELSTRGGLTLWVVGIVPVPVILPGAFLAIVGLFGVAVQLAAARGAAVASIVVCGAIGVSWYAYSRVARRVDEPRTLRVIGQLLNGESERKPVGNQILYLVPTGAGDLPVLLIAKDKYPRGATQGAGDFAIEIRDEFLRMVRAAGAANPEHQHQTGRWSLRLGVMTDERLSQLIAKPEKAEDYVSSYWLLARCLPANLSVPAPGPSYPAIQPEAFETPTLDIGPLCRWR